MFHSPQEFRFIKQAARFTPWTFLLISPVSAGLPSLQNPGIVSQWWHPGPLADKLFASSMMQQVTWQDVWQPSFCLLNAGRVLMSRPQPKMSSQKSNIIFRFYFIIYHLNICYLTCFHISHCGTCFDVFGLFCWDGQRSLFCSIICSLYFCDQTVNTLAHKSLSSFPLNAAQNPKDGVKWVFC